LLDLTQMSENTNPDSFRKLCKKVGYSLKKYQMVSPGDAVMIGVSGGKDSLFLLEALSDRVAFAIQSEFVGLPYSRLGNRIQC
jgi:hypothetical protein